MHDGTVIGGAALDALRLGRLTGPSEDGLLHVVEGANGRVEARSLVPLGAEDLGREVAYALTAEGQAVILGLLQLPNPTDASSEDEVRIDSPKRLRLTCGEASITLYPDGRVVIRGSQILSRADGANRVMGGSVHLN